jgi:pyruvate/2-oxoglutarate dehydrogenase complex dihydrolipoamide dehydrogenase (E3) component
VSHDYDLVVVGVGSAGLVAVEFAAQLGLRVAAVEASRVGGDCLWTGCVPSKALLASAKVAHHMRTAGGYGILSVEPEVDLEAVWRRIRAIQEEIASTDDSPDSIRERGVELLFGRARLASPHAVEVNGRRLDTRYVLLATGSRPAVPRVSGLGEAGFVTSETVFELERPPRRLAVLGGGPIGVELAQACRRLGMEVALFQRGARLLPRDEPELAAIVDDVLRREGVAVHLRADVRGVESENGRRFVDAGGTKLEVDSILVATGRSPNVEGLGLDDVGIETGSRGIAVDDRLRTSVGSVYAVGDVAGRYLFTHNAAHEAAVAVRNMFFPGSSSPSELVPWCTFTDPELASAGLTVTAARERHGEEAVEVWRRSLEHSDRARAEGTTEGKVVLVTAKEKLVGAHVLAPGAGELIQALALAIRQGAKLRELAGLVHVYPTIATSVQQLAGHAAYAYGRRWGRLLRVGRR